MIKSDSLTTDKSSKLLTSAASKRASNIHASVWGLFLLLGVLWIFVFNQLRFEWSVNPVYSYGWAIPFLAGYLFWERWGQRPAANPSSGHSVLTYVFPVLLLLALLPVRILQEANPDWIFIHWSLAGLATGFTFWTLYELGGRKWARYFAFPVLFVFTAVPWPVVMENFMLQSLMRTNAALAAEALSLYGMPAFVQGNLIHIGNELIGVDEACSGIRSLQTAFMMSLFLGEFYRISITRRLLLVLSSFLLAFLFNFARTLTLTYVGGTRGGEALESWHDPLGFAVLICCVGGLWLLARLFARGSEPAAKPSESRPPAYFRPISVTFLVIGAITILGSELLNAAWYKSRENNLVDRPDWSVRWNEKSRDFHFHEFPETTRTILKYNEGSSASWISSEGDDWSAYYLRWYPGRVSRYLSTAHNPEICLPAAGMRLRQDLGMTEIEVNGLSMPFHAYLFEAGNRDVYVFHSLLEDRYPKDEQQLDNQNLDRSTRLEAALEGRRNLGQRVLGISIHGPKRMEDAASAVRRELERILVVSEPED